MRTSPFDTSKSYPGPKANEALLQSPTLYHGSELLHGSAPHFALYITAVWISHRMDRVFGGTTLEWKEQPQVYKHEPWSIHRNFGSPMLEKATMKTTTPDTKKPYLSGVL
ncbi:hypothetical protein BKA70DRAFT_1431795 [Coprinopsis sp. MPI-PUGE-AT-0042]|nr:hypothetical protein BKA70DRAFT_1431795 [Coprinopsis sp. MPI-PUGE-AT-0042]